MDGQDPAGSPPSKRRKLAVDRPASTVSKTTALEKTVTVEKEIVKGVARPISPPPARRKQVVVPPPSVTEVEAASKPSSRSEPDLNINRDDEEKFLPSPVQLTRIRDLAPSDNVDTESLEGILGDPMIKECWNFNFLFDLDFVMSKFDVDVRSLVQVKIIHGFWRNDDNRRVAMHEMAERYANVELIKAYIPDPFGTHHSKMMVLLRHDDTAQVVIHTANMIARDWGNMTQAVWRSPLLPLKTSDHQNPLQGDSDSRVLPLGSGERFKVDLLSYLNAYDKRQIKTLIQELARYDFSAIRAAFLGSTPSRQKKENANPAKRTSWGWLGLQEILESITIAVPNGRPASTPNIVLQVSSIATLGQTPSWLQHFQSVLSRCSKLAPASSTSSTSKKATFFNPRSPTNTKPKLPDPTFNIIFPTPEEIRTSLDGYASGGSIHTKIQSAAQQKQLQYLRPILCHWRHPTTPTPHSSKEERREARRGPAAPHIKTYIRFSSAEQKNIDWAMITSANLSKQAWGEVENKKGEIWIQSWEAGVVAWPKLFSQRPFEHVEEGKVEMVPVFGRDLPDQEGIEGVEGKEGVDGKRVVGFRMPYDLPLSPYGADEVPWCASLDHGEPDWKGVVWGGYQPHA